MDEQKVPVLTLNTQSGAQQALEQAVAQLEAPEAPNADNAVAAALDDNFSAEERAEIERFAGTIDVTNPDHVMKGVNSITVDGKAIEGNVLPVYGDGKEHDVQVVMG